jgi:serine/threonine-protein kinase
MDRIGRYKIVRELGRGAMGVVYHAIDPNIGRPVAIKTILLAGAPNSDEQNRMRERLFREARSAGILSHPGIVTIYDVEQQGDLAYIAMEYVDGPTLDHLMAASEPLAPDRMFTVLAQTAAALDYAHGKGIVHRDVKPANIMIAADGTVKIADFGIAKVTASEQFTMTGSIVGTPHYMSPEQVQGQPVDGRSDQFSLAVVAFEMLTGEKPHTGEHLTTVVYKIVAEQPVAAHRINPTLSSGIDAVLGKGLAKKPENRYRSCTEFTAALEAACLATRGWKPMPRGAGLNAPTLADVPVPAVSSPPARAARATDDEPAPAGARKFGFLRFLGAILVAATLLALIGWQADPSLPGRFKWLSEQVTSVLHPAPPAAANTPPVPVEAPPQPAAQQPAATQPPPPAEAKPSPMPVPVAPEEAPSKTAAAAAPPAARTATRQSGPPRPQFVTLVTSPAGATASLDGRADLVCTTPCSLEAPPGRHGIVFTLAGHQVEHRQVDVGTGSLELPPVVLRSSSGTLLVSSVPPGAVILVNGKRVSGTTPTQLALAPGSYEITIEKDGRESTNKVEIGTGEVKSLKVIIER